MKLLIADDEIIEREAIQYFIRQVGLQFDVIEEAVNGIEAVAKAAALMPEILILDIKMPGKNGLEAAKEIRKFNCKCKIIFLTAFNEFEYAHQAIKIKAEDFIIKPTYSEDLFAVLTKVITELKQEQNSSVTPVSETAEGLDIAQREEILNNPTRVLVDRVCQYIDQNYNQNIKLDEVCNMVGFSRYYFSRVFKKYKNMNLVEYITLKRIERAKEMLKDPKVSIKEIGILVGYNDSNYFTNSFKKIEGISPTAYRSKFLR